MSLTSHKLWTLVFSFNNLSRGTGLHSASPSSKFVNYLCVKIIRCRGVVDVKKSNKNLVTSKRNIVSILSLICFASKRVELNYEQFELDLCCPTFDTRLNFFMQRSLNSWYWRPFKAVIPKFCTADHWRSARLAQVARLSLYKSIFLALQSIEIF
jgi:hypothetical protein